ncbi:MAG TPA: glycoside hydrolase family 38 C-terminal domain-containing protein, partial [Pyrinomonadaceae bacterium]|nr:glycoside hydrolase family 38 C-terminal domain-containing protein [Pyrinomonadaceae bacterium]
MARKPKRLPSLLLTSLLMLGAALGQTAALKETEPPATPDLTKQPTLYVVGYAHLDTQWRWEYPQTINEFLPKTMRDNFALFEKYPHYIFNFSGANRYRLMKEYYPADYARLKAYVAAGRWFPAGSSMEEGDVNSPSAESIIRQILYGTRYFRHEFGKTSAEYMLPDCFGFPASLPSILAHMGLKGFSTQKLSWGSAARVGGPGSIENTPVGIPFNVGFWEGPDGRGVIAALNPGSYDGDVSYDLSKSPVFEPGARNPPVDWPKRVELNGRASGLFTDYHYYGTGDTGGSPREPSVQLLEEIVTKREAVLPAPGDTRTNEVTTGSAGASVRFGDGPLNVVSATAEQMFLDIEKSGETSRLPRYKGELLLTNHSAGSISSETYQKRWNRKNELLADAAERASVAAMWLGGRPYPLERLNSAWTLVMGGQFHDILPGTATPKAFEFSWNDDVVAMNQFAGVLTSATESISSGLNTQTRGSAVVVYNPLNIEREDVVEANVTFPDGVPKAVRVLDPTGQEVQAQVLGEKGGAVKILFLARTPSVGFAVYDVQAAAAPSPASSSSPLKVEVSGGEAQLENSRYRLRIDEKGDVASLFDKAINRELLSAPARLAFQTERPYDWPAWNMDWEDQRKQPRAYVGDKVKVRVVESGPVRVGVEVEREAEGSKFVQTVRLSAGGASDRVEIGNVIDWKTEAAALKATFPLTASNPVATYNWDVGTVERGNNDEKKFEVPSHQWFDLTDRSNAYGVTVLSDCKNASDKPDDNTLRLTLLYTPGIGEGNGKFYGDQATQDWGHHEFTYGLASHAGDWRQGQTDWQAQRLNQPLIAFESPKHTGALGKSFSLMNVSNSRVRVLAIKKAEESDEVIL